MSVKAQSDARKKEIDELQHEIFNVIKRIEESIAWDKKRTEKSQKKGR